MRKTLEWTACSNKNPFRQGFYWVMLSDGSQHIAEFRKEGPAKTATWKIVGAAKPTSAPTAYVVSWAKATDAEIKRACAKLHSQAERIEQAYEKYGLTNMRKDSTPLFGVPPQRVLHPGDEVIVGNLSNCVVLEVRNEGILVCIKHDPFIERDADVADLLYPDAIAVWHWTDVLRKSEVNRLAPQTRRSRLNGHQTTTTVIFKMHKPAHRY